MTASGNDVIISAYGMRGQTIPSSRQRTCPYPVTWIDLPGTPVTANPLGQIELHRDQCDLAEFLPDEHDSINHPLLKPL